MQPSKNNFGNYLTFLISVKQGCDSGERLDLNSLCSQFQIGKQVPFILKLHGVISESNYNSRVYKWNNNYTISTQFVKQIKTWARQYLMERKQIRKVNCAAQEPKRVTVDSNNAIEKLNDKLNLILNALNIKYTD